MEQDNDPIHTEKATMVFRAERCNVLTPLKSINFGLWKFTFVAFTTERWQIHQNCKMKDCHFNVFNEWPG